MRTWRYRAGRAHFNRVTVYQVGEGRPIMIHWWRDGEPFTRSLRHANKARATAQAMEKAAALKAERPHHETTARIIAMRADLVRCAAIQGVPNGTGPGYEFYARHGAFDNKRICAAFRGYRGRNPADTWTEALRRFGLHARNATRCPTKVQAAADVRRVALLVGDGRRLPELRLYTQHGRWHQTTVYRALGVTTWREVADTLGLDMEAWRRDARLKCRGMAHKRWRTATPEQQQSAA